MSSQIPSMTFIFSTFIDRAKVEKEDGEDEVDENVEFVEPVNQYMVLFAFKFKVVSADDQYRCNDWVNSHMHSSLLIDELKVGKNSKTIFNVSLQFIQLKFMFSCNVFRNQFINGICMRDITKDLIHEKFQN